MNRRTAHDTTKTLARTGGEDRPEPACRGRADVYDMLGETSRSDEFEEAREAAQHMCGTCLLRRPKPTPASMGLRSARSGGCPSCSVGRCED